MKTLKTLLAFGLLLTTSMTVYANDYALLNNYPLLNDMKMAKKQQVILNKMNVLITDRENNHKAKFAKQKEIFGAILQGLSKGDKKLRLHGTELLLLKNKIAMIQLIWSQEKSILDSAINNKMYQNDAYKTLKKLSSELKALNGLYKQSYAKYKQNSVMKSLVSSYMRKANEIESVYAMNVVR